MRLASKLAKELGRIFRPAFWSRQIYTRLIRTQSKPFSKESAVRFDYTGLRATSQLVCFVSFAPNGFRQDTAKLLKLMRSAGAFDVFVVSHCPLLAADMALLERLGIQYAETTNEGYDFGAYQKFCLGLDIDRLKFDRLILMNDSFITPLRGEDISHFQPKTEVDLYGLFYGHEKRPKNLHVCSFFVSLSRKAAQSAAFQGFMGDYRPSDNRVYTIRYGEVGLSRALMDAGLSHDVAHKKSDLYQAVEGASPETLYSLASSPICQALLREAKIKTEGADLHETLKELIQKTESLALTFLYAALCGANLVKKRDLQEQGGAGEWFAGQTAYAQTLSAALKI